MRLEMYIGSGIRIISLVSLTLILSSCMLVGSVEHPVLSLYAPENVLTDEGFDILIDYDASCGSPGYERLVGDVDENSKVITLRLMSTMPRNSPCIGTISKMRLSKTFRISISGTYVIAYRSVEGIMSRRVTVSSLM